jgi:hypothetical protein
MNFELGEVVLISVFDKMQVGKVLDKVYTKSGNSYSVQAENGKVYELIYVDDKASNIYINGNLSKAYSKNK